MAARVPSLSVVVAAHDAEPTIGRTLAGLAAQQGVGGDLELIVVDDGSTDRTAEIARAAGVTLIRRERGGPAAARAEGVSASSAPQLAFVDADCVPEPGWAAAGLAALGQAELVQGRVLPDPDARLGPFDRTLWVEDDIGLYQTANLFISREAYERAGGFDAWIGPGSDARGHFGEDVLLGWAARRAGARTAFAPAAVVRHAVFARGPVGYIAERQRLAYFGELVRRVPELRRSPLFARVFLSSRSAAFDLALAGLLIAILRRRPLAAAAAVPYVVRALTEARTRARHEPLALVAGADLLADLFGFASLVEGSLRSRSAVL